VAAGYPLHPAALAIAAALASLGPSFSQAQPSGAQAIHGSAQLQQSGNTLVVTTTNGAGSNHSAINWQSFSIPQGSTTQFNQPSTSSTALNRVITNTPSQLLGNLPSARQ